jgi:hypothetical protein
MNVVPSCYQWELSIPESSLTLQSCLVLLFAMLVMEHKASHMLGKPSAMGYFCFILVQLSFA